MMTALDKAGYFINSNGDVVKKNFDITTLKPFDKVLVRNHNCHYWRTDVFSHFDKEYNRFITVGYTYSQCIPYNEETKHLVGTTEDCLEFYKTW